ncbi:HAD-IIB family hydrolase [Bifidobacterium sp.]|jgi:HAD superfamily hydrolase (TIGR01484 family)|uniref:HAD-IIB family hydrolase n=1 Tax=Bifidobacterium sp. TaxID=41200 RepID=UPI0025C325DC|nr:HAD-IIB family hydrolase [Bifidobacterium sp.]MCI1635887.1 HAD-IIB family hydrolase [Bifidobacterium sp.]
MTDQATVTIAQTWQEVNLESVCERAQVIAFDLDTTLARSKMRMTEEMGRRLATLTQLSRVAIVSGGRFEQFRAQVLDVLDGLDIPTDRTQLHLMPTSGTRYFRWNGEDWLCVYAHDLSDQDRAAAINSLERHAKELGIWEEHTWGHRIEDRGSQITFSAMGQQAPVEIKESWDPSNEKKNALASAVAKDLPHLQVRSGGSTSVDISEQGIDKAYAVRELASLLDVAVNDIVFIGDRMDPEGNDYPAALAGTMPIRVHNPDETIAVSDRIIALLSKEDSPKDEQ